MRYLTIILAIIFSVNAGATNYYVSNSGSDSNNGNSPSTAWATMAKISELAETGDHFNTNDSIFFERGGTFTGVMLGEYLNVAYFGAYGNGDIPILTGLIEITDTWEKVEGNIWKVGNSLIEEKDKIRFLFKNNTSLPLGRYPNDKYLSFQAGADVYQELFDYSQTWEDNYWQGGECVIKTSRWTIDPIEIESQTGYQINLAEETTYPLNDVNGWGHFYQDHPNTLDLEGEWCFWDGELYVYTTSDPNNSTFEFSYYDNGLYTYNNTDLNHKVQNLHFKGYNEDAIKFELFDVDNNEFVIDNSIFDYIGETAIEIAYASSVIITNNSLSNMLNNGIYYYNCGTSLVSDNTLTDIGMIVGRGGKGNDAYEAIIQNEGETDTPIGDNHIISNNSITNVGYKGISFYGAHATIIKNNYINGACLIKDDGGGIYSWYPSGDEYSYDTDHKIINNVIHNVKGNMDGVGGDEAGYLAAYAIYIDDRKQGIEISGNTLFDSEYGIFIHHSRDIDMNRNTIYNCTKGIIMRQYLGLAITDCDVYSNIFVNMNETATPDENYSLNVFGVDYIPDNNEFDSNYYINPFLYLDYITASDGTDEITYNLERWQELVNEGENSKIEPFKWSADSGVDKSEFILFDYALKDSKKVFLLGEFVDIDGNEVTGDVTIAPYSSLVLLKKSNGQLASDLTFTGPEAICMDTDTSKFIASQGSYNDYQWRITPDTAGTITIDNLTASIAWNKNHTGNIKLYLHGCKDNTCRFGSAPLEIEKLETPIPDFEINKIKKIVSFANYSENFDNVVWYFGDSDTTDQKSPIHQYVLDTTYVVTMKVSNAGCSVSLSDTVKIKTEVPKDSTGTVIAQDVDAIALPDIFTPNGDGENEAWDVSNVFLEYPNAEIRIYNRGYKLVKILNVNKLQWDGKDENGKLLPVGNYMYIIDFKNSSNKPIKRYVSILR